MAGPCIGMTEVSKEQLDRIEAKLDALLEALADEGDQDEAVEIVTMDGERVTLPATPAGVL